MAKVISVNLRSRDIALREYAIRSMHTTNSLLRPDARPGVTPSSQDPAEDPKQGGNSFFGVTHLYSSLVMVLTANLLYRLCFTALKLQKQKVSLLHHPNNIPSSSAETNMFMRKLLIPLYHHIEMHILMQQRNITEL